MLCWPRRNKTRIRLLCGAPTSFIKLFAARRVNLLFALTSEIGLATNTGEIRYLVTLLNSGDPTTLLSGTPHASAQGADVHVGNACRLQIPSANAVATIGGICSADL
jgi:hypothetical protein